MEEVYTLAQFYSVRSYKEGHRAEILSLLRTSNEEFSAELCFCVAGTFLMLLLSSLLLWEGVAPAPMNISNTGLSEVSLKDLLENATILSENISDLARDMRLEFVSTSLTPTPRNLPDDEFIVL